jgi:hypothetical protein
MILSFLWAKSGGSHSRAHNPFIRNAYLDLLGIVFIGYGGSIGFVSELYFFLTLNRD